MSSAIILAAVLVASFLAIRFRIAPGGCLTVCISRIDGRSGKRSSVPTEKEKSVPAPGVNNLVTGENLAHSAVHIWRGMQLKSVRESDETMLPDADFGGIPYLSNGRLARQLQNISWLNIQDEPCGADLVIVDIPWVLVCHRISRDVVGSTYIKRFMVVGFDSKSLPQRCPEGNLVLAALAGDVARCAKPPVFVFPTMSKYLHSAEFWQHLRKHKMWAQLGLKIFTGVEDMNTGLHESSSRFLQIPYHTKPEYYCIGVCTKDMLVSFVGNACRLRSYLGGAVGSPNVLRQSIVTSVRDECARWSISCGIYTPDFDQGRCLTGYPRSVGDVSAPTTMSSDKNMTFRYSMQAWWRARNLSVPETLKRSAFCIIPRGDTWTSSRLFLAIAALCIPVIVSDGIKLPFSESVDYEGFVIRVREKDVLRDTFSLVGLLRSLPSMELLRRRSLLRRERCKVALRSEVLPECGTMSASRLIAKKLVEMSRKSTVP